MLNWNLLKEKVTYEENFFSNNFMFQEIKNRDAWASIRGFVYQVDATIHKWLTLNRVRTSKISRE